MSATTLTVTSRHGAEPRDLAATQRRAARLVTRRAAQRAERAALEKLADAATHQNVAIATHSNRPDLSHFLDTGQAGRWLAGGAVGGRGGRSGLAGGAVCCGRGSLRVGGRGGVLRPRVVAGWRAIGASWPSPGLDNCPLARDLARDADLGSSGRVERDELLLRCGVDVLGGVRCRVRGLTGAHRPPR